MICPNCNRELSDQALFCPGCGQPFLQNAPNAGKVSGMMEESKKTAHTMMKVAFVFIVLIGLFMVYIGFAWIRSPIFSIVGVALIVGFWLFRKWYTGYIEKMYGGFQ